VRNDTKGQIYEGISDREPNGPQRVAEYHPNDKGSSWEAWTATNE